MCPWTWSVSYYCVPEHDVSLNVSLNMECILLLCPWTRSISYYFVLEDGKLTYTYPASSGTYCDNCLAQRHGKIGHFSSVSVCSMLEKTKTFCRSRYGMGEVKDGEGNTWRGGAEVENARKMILRSVQACSGDKIEKNEMDGTCSTYEREERHMQGFGGETRGKETTWQAQA
jgi:hypothetical protein